MFQEAVSEIPKVVCSQADYLFLNRFLLRVSQDKICEAYSNWTFPELWLGMAELKIGEFLVKKYGLPVQKFTLKSPLAPLLSKNVLVSEPKYQQRLTHVDSLCNRIQNFSQDLDEICKLKSMTMDEYVNHLLFLRVKEFEQQVKNMPFAKELPHQAVFTME